MPSLFDPAIPAGSLSRSAQPVLAVADVALLRPWILDDATAAVEAFDDPAIRRWHVGRADSIDEAHELLERWQGGWFRESEANWAVVDPNDDLLLGRIALKDLNLLDAIAEVAYWTCPASRGRGVCTAAVIALSNWAFRVGFHRLELEHSTLNLASCRVAVKSGFRPEGIRRSAALHADGWHDMHLHSLLATDDGPTDYSPT